MPSSRCAILFLAHTRERASERAADGVLLVQKPDRFRLRLSAAAR
jgi:hypothetical protein